jgi:hypothetical protein
MRRWDVFFGSHFLGVVRLGDPQSSKPSSESQRSPSGIPAPFRRICRKASFAFSVWHCSTFDSFFSKREQPTKRRAAQSISITLAWMV